MKFRKIKLLSTILATTLFSSIAGSSLYAADLTRQNDSLFFSTYDEINVKSFANKEVSIVNFNNELPDLQKYDSFAYNVKDVESNKDLRLFLQKALLSGKKVYLYGGLTPDQYSELLNQPLELTVKDTNTGEERNVTIRNLGYNEGGKINEEHGDKATTVQEVIGYTLEDSSNKAFMLNYINMDENGKEIPTDSTIILNQILKHEERQADFTTSSATIIKSSNGDIRTVGGLYGQDNAEMLSQWMLYKESNESDNNYDYYALKDIIQINKLGGSTNAKRLYVEHYLAYANDDLYSAAPESTSSGPYTVEFGYPWTLSWSFTYSGNPNVTLNENWNTDTATWNIEADYLQNLQSSNRFQLGTSWKAADPDGLTGVVVSHLTEWHSAVSHMFDLENSFYVGS